MRSGTLAVHQIVGFGEAAHIAVEEMTSDTERIARLRERLLGALREVGGMSLNGDARARIPHNLNLAFRLEEGAALLPLLEDIAVSAGSACASGDVEPSHVLRAIGCPDELAHNSIRITLGRWTSEEEVDFAANLIRRLAAQLGAQ
jgi:cysteine desulfurase